MLLSTDLNTDLRKGGVEGEDEGVGGQAGGGIGGEEEQVGHVLQPPLLHEGVHLLCLLPLPKLKSVRHGGSDTTGQDTEKYET